MATSNLNSLPLFKPAECESGEQWRRWLRAFQIYLTARKINSDEQRVALLLHCAGIEFQDLYYTLTPDIVSFQDSLALLNDHFLPKKQNATYERHLFRQLQKEKGETIDNYLCRLRVQAENCSFDKVDEAMRDQIIEKCSDLDLKKKMLEKTGDVELKDIVEIAKAHEVVEKQLKAMNIAEPITVNAVKSSDRGSGVNRGRGYSGKSRRYSSPDRGNPARGRGFSNRGTGYSNRGRGNTAHARKCYRCDQQGHFQRDPNCPAKYHTCQKCGKKGHFSRVCYTKNVYNVSDPKFEDEVNDIGDNFNFCVDYLSSIQSKDGTVDLKVGGVNLENVLIDSGATCNIVNYDTWEQLKQNQIKCKTTKSYKKLYAYPDKPIETVGVFNTLIECANTSRQCQGEFIVVKGRGKCILGKESAIKLNVLRVGPPQVCTIETQGVKTDIINSYPKLFVGIGKYKDYEMNIHVDKSVKPIAQPLRRVPFGLQNKVNEKLDELLKNDIIEEVKSGPTEWVSPLVVVPKPNADVRICVDMRRANVAIVRERHPIPTVEEILYKMNGSTVFSKVDLKWGFHQIVLNEQSRDITTFVTPRGLYRYKRLMFGLKSAPEKYQKIVGDIISDLVGVANIADDIVVHGENLREHDKNLFKLLERLQEVGLTVNKDKCEFRVPMLTFFGQNLGKNGISASQEKIGAIVNANPPQTKSETRSFLGLVQFCAKFIPNLAEIAAPLRYLTREKVEFNWSCEANKSFEELKQLISRAETMAYFKNDCQTRIISDAGPSGLGAVLTQLQNEKWQVIAYASRALTDVEKRYSQTEKEALGLVWACERFSLYVLGRKFELETDHKPLECIYSTKSKPCARIERWVLRLQGFDYKVVYRPGKSNIADALSRLNNPVQTDNSGDSYDFIRTVVEYATPVALTPKEIELETSKDGELLKIINCVRTNDWSNCVDTAYLAIKGELSTYGNYLLLRGHRLVIPKSLRLQVLNLAHEGHQGIVKTKNRLRQKVWWPKIDQEAEKLCRSCTSCQVVGGFCPPEPMVRTKLPDGPWQDLAVDLMGPLPNGESLLVTVDYYSRFFEVDILKSTTADKVIAALLPHFMRFGFPYSVKSDNGPQFISGEFKKFMLDHAIEHRKSTPLWPQANGEVERQNRSLLKCLKIAQVEKQPWKDELYKFIMAYRCTPHTITGYTPAKLMFNRELRSKIPEMRQLERLFYEDVQDRDQEKKLLGKIYADKKRNALESSIKVGDSVFLKNTRETGKLTPKFETTPYQVIEKRQGEVTIQKDGVNYKRATSFVKPVVQSQLNENVLLGNKTIPDKSKDSIESPSVTETTLRRNPSRNIRPPSRFKDFVKKIV